jgi:hypothetical protein
LVSIYGRNSETGSLLTKAFFLSKIKWFGILCLVYPRSRRTKKQFLLEFRNNDFFSKLRITEKIKYKFKF